MESYRIFPFVTGFLHTQHCSLELMYHIPLYELPTYFFILMLMDISSSLQFGASTNNSAMNIFTRVSWYTSTHISIGYKRGNGISKS